MADWCAADVEADGRLPAFAGGGRLRRLAQQQRGQVADGERSLWGVGSPGRGDVDRGGPAQDTVLCLSGGQAWSVGAYMPRSSSAELGGFWSFSSAGLSKFMLPLSWATFVVGFGPPKCSDAWIAFAGSRSLSATTIPRVVVRQALPGPPWPLKRAPRAGVTSVVQLGGAQSQCRCRGSPRSHIAHWVSEDRCKDERGQGPLKRSDPCSASDAAWGLGDQAWGPQATQA